MKPANTPSVVMLLIAIVGLSAFVGPAVVSALKPPKPVALSDVEMLSVAKYALAVCESRNATKCNLTAVPVPRMDK